MVIVSVQVSDPESMEIDNAAKRLGLKRSEFLRRILRKAMLDVKGAPDEPFVQLLRDFEESDRFNDGDAANLAWLESEGVLSGEAAETLDRLWLAYRARGMAPAPPKPTAAS